LSGISSLVPAAISTVHIATGGTIGPRRAAPPEQGRTRAFRRGGNG